MKSTLLFALISLLSISVFAAPGQPKIACSNEMPTTTFNLQPAQVDGKDVTQLIVKHYYGAANAPIHSGVITGNDFAYLKQKAEVVAKLGDELKINFSQDKCEHYGLDLWSCSNGEKQKINGVTVSGTNFSTRVVETKFYDYTFKTHQLTFSFVYEGMMYDMPMIFSPEECLISNL